MRALLTLVLVLAPAAAHACAVCGAGEDANGKFLETTIFLSLLPLGLIGGAIAWALRRHGRLLRDEFVDRDAPPGGSRPSEGAARR